jgi:hypothetical protein
MAVLALVGALLVAGCIGTAALAGAAPASQKGQPPKLGTEAQCQENVAEFTPQIQRMIVRINDRILIVTRYNEGVNVTPEEGLAALRMLMQIENKLIAMKKELPTIKAPCAARIINIRETLGKIPPDLQLITRFMENKSHAPFPNPAP